MASNISRIDASKLGDAKCSTREADSGDIFAFSSSCTAARPRWGTITPLGLPVEPEV